MTNELILSQEVHFNGGQLPSGHSISNPIRNVLIVADEVVHSRYLPALNWLSGRISGIVVCGGEAHPNLDGLSCRHFRVLPENLLPLDDLDGCGFLSRSTLAIIAMAPNARPHYAYQLAGFCRSGLETPLASNLALASILGPLAKADLDIFPIDYRLFSIGARRFITSCRLNSISLRRLHHITGAFYENTAFSCGSVRGARLGVTQAHLFAFIIAVFNTSFAPFCIVLDRVEVAANTVDNAGESLEAAHLSASRIQGRIISLDREVTFEFCQAETVPSSDKGVQMLTVDGLLLAQIDLNENGWLPHLRVLEELLSPEPNMYYSLADAIQLANLVDVARAKAENRSPYHLGDWPEVCGIMSAASSLMT